MTRLLLIVILILLLGSSVHAHDYQFADEWDAQDTILEVVHTGLWLIDWHQTAEISRHPERWHEHNPILGHHPSARATDNYFILGVIMHPLTSVILPPPYRTWWQGFTIGLEAGCIGINYSIGIR